MTWITDIKKHIYKKYKIQPKIIQNYKTRYNKFHNKAVFEFARDNSEAVANGFADRHDFTASGETVTAIRSVLKNDVKFRFEWWFETLAYFNDIDEFLSAVPKKHLEKIISLELMNPMEIAAIAEHHQSEHSVSLTVMSKLPYDRYRYRIHVSTASKTRRKIGIDNLRQIYDSISLYDGIKFTNGFSGSKTDMYLAAGNAYFYSETIDWLPLIVLLEPAYIKRIEKIKTSQEIKNESTN